jgi:long-chain fatty acid transport protein
MKTQLSTRVLLALGMCCVSGVANAAGFALYENNASGAGNAYAGAAAVAEDASTAWSNPAGMSLIGKRQVVLGLHAIDLNSKFSDDGSRPAAGRTLNNTGGDVGDLELVPNTHFITPINDRTMFGLAINAPYGLSTHYNKDWAGRFQAVTSDIKSIFITPSMSYKVNKDLSIGGGISLAYLQATLTQAVNFPGPEGTAAVKGDSWSYGVNLGLMYQLTPATRLGVTFHSDVKQDVKGNITYTGSDIQGSPALATAFSSGPLKSTMHLPASVSISTATQFNQRWQGLFDLTATQWSSIRVLQFDRTGGLAGAAPIPANTYEWKDAVRISVGANYQCNERTKARFGLAFDQTPVSTQNRTARLPDSDRYIFALGGQYALSKQTRLDVGYQLFLTKKSNIDNRDEGDVNRSGLLNGSYNNSKVHILSAQVAYDF